MLRVPIYKFWYSLKLVKRIPTFLSLDFHYPTQNHFKGSVLAWPWAPSSHPICVPLLFVDCASVICYKSRLLGHDRLKCLLGRRGFLCKAKSPDVMRQKVCL